MDEKEMQYEEFETINIELKDGSEAEFAILDRFDYEEKSYVVVARVVNDEISQDGLFIYQAEDAGDEITVTELDREAYGKVTEYYMNL